MTVEVMQQGLKAREQVLAPRGVNRTQAAANIGVSPATFDKMIVDGRMPEPKHINSRNVWDIRAIDRAFDMLPGGSQNDADDWSVEI